MSAIRIKEIAGVVRVCSFPKCGRPLHGRIFCDGHYRQSLKGRPLRPLTRSALTLEERFWEKVNKEFPGDCWEWLGHRNRDGYGTFQIGKQSCKAHRVAYTMFVNPIPEGVQVDHKCHNRACVKPDHLRLVRHHENLQNLSGARSDSSSGIRGVSWNNQHKKWHAYARLLGESFHIGYFLTIEEAELAVIKWRRENMPYSINDQPLQGPVSVEETI